MFPFHCTQKLATPHSIRGVLGIREADRNQVQEGLYKQVGYNAWSVQVEEGS